MTTTPNMNLVVPGVGSTVGPDYATNINDDLSRIDQHDHSAGNGVQITPDGLNINDDLAINSHNLNSVRAMRVDSQNSALVLAADIRCIYSVSGDLYYNNSSGTAVQITSGGSIVGTAGSITGLPSGTAGVAYSSGSTKYIFTSATNTSALLDAGSIIMRNSSASSYGLTLAPPAAMASDRTLTLPSLPASTKMMVMTSGGTMSASYDTDNSTIEVSSNNLQLKDGGITNAKVNASAAIAYSKLNLSGSIVNADVNSSAAISRTKLEAPTTASGGSSGTFATSSTSATALTSASAILNTTGVGGTMELSLQPYDGSSVGEIELTNSTSPGNVSAFIQFLQDSAVIGWHQMRLRAQGSTAVVLGMPLSAFRTIISTPNGSYNYSVKVYVDNASSTLTVVNYKLQIVVHR